jgi:putative SOS response-associated peptidase YedK
MGIAGLWSRWKSPQGEIVHSYTMLTINAADHPLMRHFHKPTDEKRMVVILPVERYDEWLEAGPAQSQGFMRQFPADQMIVDEPKVDGGLV